MSQKLNSLQKSMQSNGINALIIPSADPHQSEYVADYWKLRAFFSDFTGSAGTLVITHDTVALWTDSRYFLQVEMECKDNGVKLHKQTIPHAPEHIPWLCDLLNEGDTIALDFRQFSKSQIDYLLNFANVKNIQLKDERNFADDIWLDRPSLPNYPIIPHTLEFSGETTASKLKKVQENIISQNANYYFISALDEIAWLFNIRSQDVDHTPLVTAYALVGINQTFIFCNKKRFSKNIISEFSKLNITIKNYDDIFNDIHSISKNKIIITDSISLNYATFKSIQGKWIYQNSIVKELKSIKNEIEIKGARKCMIKDGIALTRFFIWLEKELKTNSISEYDIGRKLETFRALQKDYVSESFSAIVGYKSNGAIMHYTAPKENSAMVYQKGILLIDSGGQYQDGTTDITRTIWLGGLIPDKIKTAYTAVLKGYIELEQIQFPVGTTGIQLDAFARMHLWKNGLNYPHGTGHGIGSFGMVHEPEQGFATSTTTSRGSAIHTPNQLTTIEPGCYINGEFGIRTENIVLSKVVNQTDFGDFIGFEVLSLCFIDTQLIHKEMLDSSEINWLNNYHANVLKKLSPFLNDGEIDWLSEKCKTI